MEHSEWLKQYREELDFLTARTSSLKDAVEENIRECLRRNNNKTIKFTHVFYRFYWIETVRLTEDWRIVLDTTEEEEVIFGWNELETATQLNVYEACIKALNLG